MKTFELAYGPEFRSIEIDEKNLIRELVMEDLPHVADLESSVREALNTPSGTPSLKEMLIERKPKSLVIIVSDHTRFCLYQEILPVMTDYILASGIPEEAITFVVASGTHPLMNTDDLLKQYGETARKFKFETHDCHAEDLVEMGELKSGNKLFLNKTVSEADFLLTTGIVNTHYMAGFGGGAKSILPGVSGYKTIQANHAMVLDSNVNLAQTTGNPIFSEMREAAKFAGVDFTILF